MPAKGLCFHSMRTARFGAQRMTDSKRKAQATLGAFFSGNATNTGADAASNKAPRTTAGASSSSSGGKRSEWLKRGEPAVSVMVRTRGIRVGDPLELSSSTRVAAFDFDSTLVETLSGSRFPKNPGDWKVFNQHVKPKLQQLHADGYRLVIISNQAGVDKTMDKPKAVTVRGRIDNFVRHMGVPMEALCATQKDCYRKGMGTGMWDLMASTTGQGLSVGGVAPLKEESFFVGDAAGRPKDFADTDKLFAEAVELDFHVPEDFFVALPAAAAAAAAAPAPSSAVSPTPSEEASDRDEERDNTP